MKISHPLPPNTVTDVWAKAVKAGLEKWRPTRRLDRPFPRRRPAAGNHPGGGVVGGAGSAPGGGGFPGNGGGSGATARQGTRQPAT